MTYFKSNAKDFIPLLEACLEDAGKANGPLRELPLRLVELTQSGQKDTAEKAVQLLGTAVGKDKTLQTQFRESGILVHALRELSISASAGLVKQYLRVIGNSVADNNENRAIVVQNFGPLISSFKQEHLTTTALAVMLNLCNDYVPAQKEAARMRLDQTIAKHLACGQIPEEAVDYAVDLLTWTTEELSAAEIDEDSSLQTFEHILTVALRYDEDHYHDYVAILAHYLQSPEFQVSVAASEKLESLIDLALDFQMRLEPEEVQKVFEALATQEDPDKPQSEETNVLLMVQLINSLSAISASDAFVNRYGTGTPLIKKVCASLASSSNSPFTVSAYLILGNLATSDEASISLVENLKLHTTAFDVLSSSSEPALLYAAAGFVRHLAFPSPNRTVLGGAGLIDICCRLLNNGDPSVRGEAAAIIGKLVINNRANIERVVYGTLPDGVVLAQLPDVEIPQQPSILRHIVTQALAPSAPVPSTSMKNEMIELGRTIVIMLRYIGQNSTEDVKIVAQDMLKTPLIAKPIARLVRQRFFADARSEGLLGLALMTQSPDGAARVVEEIQADDGLLEAIKEFTTSQKKETQQDQMSLGRDHQNALVLLHGLVTNGVGEANAQLKDQVESLQTELSKLLL